MIILLLLGFSKNLQSQNFQNFDTNYKFYYGSKYKNESTYFKFYIPAYEMGVFTLKSLNYNTDYDLYVYNSSSLSSVSNKSTNSGLKTELIMMPLENYGRWVYIQVKNDGNYGKFNFYAHNIDVRSKFLQAALVAIINGIFSNESEVDQRNISRGLNIGLSYINNSSLWESSKSFVLNELTNELREELGYGSVADFFVTFIVSIYGDALKNYW